MSEVTHDLLVQKAERWLAGTRGCDLVRTEVQAFCLGEYPDAIGWEYGKRKIGLNAQPVSVLVECKVSLADFYSDRSKAHRNGHGVGDERWYMCPKGVIQPEQVQGGWGLLWLRGSRVYREKPAQRRERSKESLRHELALLAAVNVHSYWKGIRVGERRTGHE